MSLPQYKLHAVWSIKKDTFLMALEQNKDFIESEEFSTTLPGVHYSLCIYPEFDGYLSPPYEGFTCIQLLVNSDVIVGKMKLHIRSAHFRGDLEYDERGGRYPNHFMPCLPSKDFVNPENKFFINDILIIEVNGILSWKTKPKFDLGKILFDKSDRDFTLIVGKTKIMAHKFILSQFSSVFVGNKDNEFTIENFDPKVVTAAVKLCYGLDYWKSFSVDETFKLIKFTNIYKLPLIKDEIERCLIESINAENVCELANKSLVMKAENLCDFCVNFLSDCIKNGKPFDGSLNNLNPEIVALVFKQSFGHYQLS